MEDNITKGCQEQETKPLVVCSNCGTNIESDSRFCPTCGRPINIVATKKFCSTCGIELKEEEMFCHNCGSPTSQTLDNQAADNIAAYNNNLYMPKKKPSIINIKETSFFSFFSWIITAVFAGLTAAGAITIIAADFCYSYHPLFDKFLIACSVGYLLTTISGLLFWKNDKKLCLIPIGLSLVSSLFAMAGIAVLSGYILGSIATAFVVGLAHLVAGLIAMKLIKSKVWTIVLSIALLASPWAFSVLLVMAGKGYLFDPWVSVVATGLLVPMFFLCFSYTSKELKEITNKKKIITKIVYSAISLVSLLAIAFAFLYYMWIGVGDYTNMHIGDALEECSRLYVEVKYDYSDTVAKDLVIRQSVEEGTYLHSMSNNKIVLTVSKGKGYKVPKVYNLTYKVAKNKITKAGFKTKVVYKYNSKVAKGKVFKVSKTIACKGEVVTLKVSKGPDTRVVVPHLIDLTESQARRELQNRGFKVRVRYTNESCDAYYKEGLVTAQSKTSKQKKGSTVTISVAKPSVVITQVNFDHNSVGGVDIDISFRNNSGKTIKYITFKARFKNAVGDDVYCEIKDTCTRNLQFTGPMYSGITEKAYWDAVVYAWNCKQIHFDEIEVEFMDGTSHTMTYGGYWY